MSKSVNPVFWKGKKVFITGHTGFKGSWLSLWLQSMGADVKGFALEPPTKPALFVEARVKDEMISEVGDIRDLTAIKKSIAAFEPEILFHMAAQPLVRLSYRDPVQTYATNVMGTVHVLEAARSCNHLKAIVNVTTDKCYENREWAWGYRENEPMGGHDPYSNSKGCSELVTAAYRNSYFYGEETPSLASARAGNVIGGGDWAEDRLIPDILRAFEHKETVIIRNPRATRPWQHVLEPLSGYILLAEKLYVEGDNYAEPWNFGPRDDDVKPVEWILDRMVDRWGAGAKWKLDLESHPHEAQLLKLDISKANAKLRWSPQWSLSQTLDTIVDWHRCWLQGDDIQRCTLDQIQKYQTILINNTSATNKGNA